LTPTKFGLPKAIRTERRFLRQRGPTQIRQSPEKRKGSHHCKPLIIGCGGPQSVLATAPNQELTVMVCIRLGDRIARKGPRARERIPHTGEGKRRSGS
jgi:hypothetical protein